MTGLMIFSGLVILAVSLCAGLLAIATAIRAKKDSACPPANAPAHSERSATDSENKTNEIRLIHGTMAHHSINHWRRMPGGDCHHGKPCNSPYG